MKLYEEIYFRNNLPQDDTKLMVIGQGDRYPLGGITEIKGPLICMTIEELREMFKQARRKTERGDAPYIYPTAEEYLTSKGINI